MRLGYRQGVGCYGPVVKYIILSRGEELALQIHSELGSILRGGSSFLHHRVDRRHSDRGVCLIGEGFR